MILRDHPRQVFLSGLYEAQEMVQSRPEKCEWVMPPLHPEILFILHAGLSLFSPSKVWRNDSAAKSSLNRTRIVLSFYRWRNRGPKWLSHSTSSGGQHSPGETPNQEAVPNPSLPQDADLPPEPFSTQVWTLNLQTSGSYGVVPRPASGISITRGSVRHANSWTTPQTYWELLGWDPIIGVWEALWLAWCTEVRSAAPDCSPAAKGTGRENPSHVTQSLEDHNPREMSPTRKSVRGRGSQTWQRKLVLGERSLKMILPGREYHQPTFKNGRCRKRK